MSKNKENIENLNELNISPIKFPRIEIEKNSAAAIVMTQDSETQLKDTTYEKCVFKQGYLAQIINQNYEGEIPILHTQPIFTVINKQTIAFFKDENVDTVLKTIDLNSLKTPNRPKLWSYFHCFQLISSIDHKDLMWDQINTISETVDQQVDMNLCANTEEQVIEWLTAIDEFHACNIEYEIMQTNQKPKQDSSDALQLNYKQENIQKSASLVLINPEFQEDIENQKDQMVLNGNSFNLKKIFSKIQDILKQEKAQNLRQQRQFMSQLNEEKLKTEELQIKQQCLQKQLRSKAYKKARIKRRMILQNEQNVTGFLIHKAQDKILEAAENTDQKLSKYQINQIEQEKIHQEKIKQEMLNDALKLNKQSNQKKCFSWELQKSPYYQMQDICVDMIPDNQIPSPYDLNECMKKSSFCSKCCNWEIPDPIIEQSKLLSCISKCENALNQQQGIIFDDQGFIINVSESNKIN